MNVFDPKPTLQKTAGRKIVGIVALLFAALCILNWCDPELKKPILSQGEYLWKQISGGCAHAHLEVHFIDVGQGDSTLIITPSKEVILIDAGYESAGKKVVHYLLDQKISHIDYLIATHSDLDHIGGMKAVFRAIDVQRFCIPATVQITPELESLLDDAHQKSASILHLKAGDSLDLNQEVSALVLNPLRSFYLDANQYSIVLLLGYGKTTFLFQGDATETNEREMLKAFPNLRADILKAGHHGSDTSTSEEFLQQIHPKAVLVSCGYKNDYGHPSTKILTLLEKYHIPLYRTDEQGNILFFSDGNQIQVNQKYPGSYAPAKNAKKR